MSRKLGLALSAVFMVGLVGSWQCIAGPTVVVGARVPATQRMSMDRIDHSSWDALLKKYVDANGNVNYTAWKASAPDQQALDQYLSHLSSASSQRVDRNSQLAFWINTYNAVTVKGILREYPTTSIRNHTAKLVGYNIWKDLQIPVADQPHSLEGIEHEILRKMGEPRVHFAIVCASMGCPRLLNEAYTAEKVDAQLTLNTQAFFADPTKFKADPRSGAIQVSPILEWFAEDFGGNAAAQMKTIAPYVPEAAQGLANSGRARVSYLGYDWGLNDRSPAGGSSQRK